MPSANSIDEPYGIGFRSAFSAVRTYQHPKRPGGYIINPYPPGTL